MAWVWWRCRCWRQKAKPFVKSVVRRCVVTTSPKATPWFRKNTAREKWPTALREWSVEVESLAAAAAQLEQLMNRRAMSTEIDASTAWFEAEDNCSAAAQDLRTAAAALRQATADAARALTEDRPID